MEHLSCLGAVKQKPAELTFDRLKLWLLPFRPHTKPPITNCVILVLIVFNSERTGKEASVKAADLGKHSAPRLIKQLFNMPLMIPNESGF